LPFLYWIRQNPNIKDLLHHHIGFSEERIFQPRNGVYAPEVNYLKAAHSVISRDFEFSIIDRMLRFMAQQDAARSNVP
jgi:hypothetical protein